MGQFGGLAAAELTANGLLMRLMRYGGEPPPGLIPDGGGLRCMTRTRLPTRVGCRAKSLQRR